MTTTFPAPLIAEGPAPDRADKLGLYGWLVGDWIFDAEVTPRDGAPHRGEGRISFGWVLEGRAIQDVWVLPGMFHGTTLRIYDPTIDAWHIIWSDPLRPFFSRQIGRAEGSDIVQLGTLETGEMTRWRFFEITPASFRWTGEISADGGSTWHRQSLYRARRVTAPRPATDPMLDHVSIGVKDIPRAGRFYDAVLAPLGYRRTSAGDTYLGYGAGETRLWLGQTATPVPADMGSGLHFCFAAQDRAAVDAFHQAGLAQGGTDNGAPGLRGDYGPSYYAAFLIDPDGYRIEAYCGKTAA